MKNLFLLSVIAAIGNAASATSADELERLKYNHPGLKVDLGVGLWAWPMPIDYDRDGDLDLLVGCPDKPSNGVYLFENPAGPGVKFPVFKPGRRLGPAKQYLTLSHTGDVPHVLAGNQEYPNFLRGDFETTRKVYPKATVAPAKNIRGNFWRYVDYDGDGNHDLLVGQDVWDDFGWFTTNDWWRGYAPDGSWTRGPMRGWTFVLRNEATDAAPKYAEPIRLADVDGKPLETYGWPGSNYADFDGDGDLDLLCGEFLDGFTYFANVGTSREPKFAAGVRLAPHMDLQMIVPHAVDWDADGDVDLVVGDEDGRVALVEHTGRVVDGVPQFAAPRYFQQEQDEIDLGVLATPVGTDWDGDGDTDLLAGNSAGYLVLVENLSGIGVEAPRFGPPRRLEAGGETIRILAGPNGSIQGPAEAKWGYTTIGVADWDGDGRQDVVMNSIWGRVQWYRNLGPAAEEKPTAGATKKPARRFPLPTLAAAQPIEVAWPAEPARPQWNWWKPQGNELVTQWRTTPVAVDFTADGLCDLVMLDHEGYLCLWERARDGERTVLKPGARVLCDESGTALRLNPGEGGRSGRRKLTVVDWDRDGRLDLLVNSKNAEMWRGLGQNDGVWKFAKSGDVSTRNIEGHDTSPTSVDFDGDDVPDLLIGAEDGKLYYLRNPRGLKARAAATSSETSAAAPAKPIRMLDLPGIDDPKQIDFAALPRIPVKHAVVSASDKEWQFRLHNYLLHHDGKFWAMWSHGPIVEDRATQHVRWSTSSDGLDWSEPRPMMSPPEPPLGWIARDFWVRDGRLLALAAQFDDPQPFGGGLLDLHAFAWNPQSGEWQPEGLVCRNAINNFAPQRLPSGSWLMTRRDSRMNAYMLTGGEERLDAWTSHPVTPRRRDDGFSPDEPMSWPLSDGRWFAAFRDNGGSKRLFQATSDDQGRTWTTPVLTNFPDATSKLFSLATSRGYRVLISNANPAGRNPLCLSISRDGEHFTWLGALDIPGIGTLQYPHAIEHDGKLLIAFSRNKKNIEVVQVELDELDRVSAK